MLGGPAQSPEPITLELTGAAPAAEQRYALDKIRWLAVQAPLRVDRVRVTIIARADPAAAHRVRVRASDAAACATPCWPPRTSPSNARTVTPNPRSSRPESTSPACAI